jgi:predicted RNase H-like HicB family nuclease
MRYLYIVEKAKDGSYSAYVPDLPGCTTSGETIDEVKTGIRDAVDLYVEELRSDGQPVPEPSTTADMVDAA